MTGDAPAVALAQQWAYWQTESELRFQRCTSCREWIHLPRTLCPECGSESLAWEASSGTGKLYSWTRTHRAFNPAFGVDVPYVGAIVELDEGVRMLSRIVNAPDGDIAIGAPVTVSFESAADAPSRAVFRLTTHASEADQ